ncbi:MFS transporter [Frondihabitans australicus]|uniref:Putative MFS family arabinose efflux permease n=1 Tax=Frondihabitans australicus TaxID=386892 RepID=A0A495ICQ0_9MICO|nr:MFS transporter [Frondihabitans australicus]RKR73081.1 putative MFS family arabinose efflux permease [Frondihabitans australicus]
MLGRSAAFVVAATVGAATLSAASAPSPLYPVYQRLFGFSSLVLTVVFAVYVVALLVALLTVGSVSDIVGRRPVASAALVLLAVGMMLFAGAEGTGTLLVARIVQGFAVGAATGTITAMILDAAPGPVIGSVVSSAFSPLGIAIGAVLSGALVEFAPLPRQLVYWVLGAVYVVLAGLVWLVPEPGREGAERNVDGHEGTRPSVWRSLVPSAALPVEVAPTFAALAPSISATWALAGLYLSLGSSVIGDLLGVTSHFVIGLVLGVFFASGIAGTALSAALRPQLREPFGYGALAAGVAVTMAATASSSLPVYLVGSVLAGAGFGASFRFAVNALGEKAPPESRGEVFATMYIVSYLAFSVPALVAGLAVEAVGLEPTALGYGCLVIALVAGASVASARIRRRGASDTTKKQEQA